MCLVVCACVRACVVVGVAMVDLSQHCPTPLLLSKTIAKTIDSLTLARATPPASGETMTGFWRFLSLKYDRAIGPAKRLSTGVRGPKKP